MPSTISSANFCAWPETMQTDKGKAMAQHNARFLVEFMAKLSAELQGKPLALDEAVLRRFAPPGVNRPVIYGTLCQNRPRWLRICRKS